MAKQHPCATSLCEFLQQVQPEGFLPTQLLDKGVCAAMPFKRYGLVGKRRGGVGCKPRALKAGGKIDWLSGGA